jgi:chaperonin GroEL (HSP60 family)
MNSFEESIIAAAQDATPNNTEAERAAAKATATEAVARIMATTSGLQRTLALAALLDSYSEPDGEDE